MSVCIRCVKNQPHTWHDNGEFCGTAEVGEPPRQESSKTERIYPKGDPRFHALLEEIGKLHDKKQLDYGREHDPFANVRASDDFGVPGWIGALIRANDKMRRLQKAARGGALANESVEDSFMDLAVYALIGLILYREWVETRSAS